MNDQTTPEWIAERVDAMLSSHPRAAVHRTMPVVLLFMARDFGVKNLEPRYQRAVEKVLTDVGISDAMDKEEITRRTVTYIERLGASDLILNQLADIFRQHGAAVAERGSRKFARALGKRQMPAVLRYDEPAPAGTFNAGDFARQVAGRIRM